MFQFPRWFIFFNFDLNFVLDNWMFWICLKSLRIVLEILTVEIGKCEKNEIFSLGILKNISEL